VAIVLSITASQLLSYARLDILTGTELTQATADANAVLTGQEGQEKRIKSANLSDLTLRPTLTLGVLMVLAAELLERRTRDGSDKSFTGGGITSSGTNEYTDYSSRLRREGLDILAPYLVLAPTAGESASEVAVRTAQADKLEAETAIVAPVAESEIAKREAEAAKIAAETAKIADERARLVAQTGAVVDERARLAALADKTRTDAIIAQVAAGILTANEARVELGYIGAVPALPPPVVALSDTSESPRSAASQSRLFGRSEGSRGIGGDNW